MKIENMSSQFIHKSNQNLLWKIINNTPQMIRFFEGAIPGEKERWFQQVIRHVHEDNLQNSPQLGLRELNKVAIDLMVELLKKEHKPVHKPVQVSSEKTVPIPTFAENIKDEAIGDIGSVVNEYMKQRELDNKMFAPPSNVSIEIEEIDNTFSAKKVKWGENTEHVYKENNGESVAKILELLETLIEHGKTIKSLIEKINT